MIGQRVAYGIDAGRDEMQARRIGDGRRLVAQERIAGDHRIGLLHHIVETT